VYGEGFSTVMGLGELYISASNALCSTWENSQFWPRF
jgi:hypothetical protein